MFEWFANRKERRIQRIVASMTELERYLWESLDKPELWYLNGTNIICHNVSKVDMAYSPGLKMDARLYDVAGTKEPTPYKDLPRIEWSSEEVRQLFESRFLTTMHSIIALRSAVNRVAGTTP